MSRCAPAVAALLLSPFALGQTTPKLQLAPAAPAANLLKDSSFEEPPVSKRLSAQENGSPSKAPESKTNWTQLSVLNPDKEGEGKLTVGLTNEFARSGKQSVFVDFDKLTGINRRSHLLTDILPVKPASGYRISIWGRTDGKRPLTLDQRLAFMKVEIEYFTPNTENQSGETEHRTLMIPGNSKRIFFVSNKWTEYSAVVRTPRDAGWMKVTFRWETGRDKGMTDGMIYFDDASVTHQPLGDSFVPVDDSDAPKPEPEEPEDAAAPEPAAVPNAAPASPKAPAKQR